jgi:DNA-binding MarR family transcriptional regulator
MRPAPPKPLSALLSQILVAYTVEIDSEFERRMLDETRAAARLSLVIWLNLMQFLAGGPVSVRTLASRALSSAEQVKAVLGCLERWGFIVLQTGEREGFGSGRGIRADWLVGLTAGGETAIRIWPELIPEIDARWMRRFGDDGIKLRTALEAIERQLDLELPEGLPGALLQLPQFAPRQSPAVDGLPLAVLLSRALLAFALDFELESRTPIWLCANPIRVLSDEPMPEAEIPRRTGCSAETAGIGWQHKPYMIVERDPARGRGKFVRLSEAGIHAQHEYYRISRNIEEKWKERYGAATKEIRGLLTTMLNRFELSEGLKPPAGTTRAGNETPALGRLAIGPAARQRMRDLVNQTEAFVRDPAGALPHYPLWDMNRGFGP